MTRSPYKYAAIWMHMNGKMNSSTTKEYTYSSSNFNTYLPEDTESTGLSICSWLPQCSRTAHSHGLSSPQLTMPRQLPQPAQDNSRPVNEGLGKGSALPWTTGQRSCQRCRQGSAAQNLPLHNRK